jgi:hypothetical protein
MSEIRALREDDVPAVAALHAGALGRPELTERLASFFERTLVAAPPSDPEIPSLVALDGGAIVGFLGSYVRPMEFEGRQVRMACSAHLLTDRSVRTQALGALILRRYLDGPQDVTITDGATREVQRMWESFGGATAHLQSLVWVEPIRPAALAAHRLAHRFSAARLETALRPLSALVDLPVRRLLHAEPAEYSVAPAGPAEFARAVSEVTGGFALRPLYDEAYLGWLFAELRRIAAEPPVFPDRVERGDLATCVVSLKGRTAGAFACQTRRGGACRVLAAYCAERDAPLVLAAARTHAEANGAAAVFGRVEPHLLAALWQRRVLIRFGGGRMLVRSGDARLESAPARGDAIVTRLDGEWW